MFAIKNFGIAKKLLVLVAMTTSGIILLTAIFLSSERKLIMQERELGVQQAVEIALSTVQHYRNAAEKGDMSDDEARQRALEAIRALRYGNNEYFSIYDLRGRVLMHPITASLQGKDLYGIKDATGKQFMAEFVEVVRSKGAGFVTYHWPRPGSDKPIPKTAYVKSFEPWGWIVSTGVYIDGVQETFLERLTEFSLWALGLVIALASLCILIARSITRPLNDAVKIAQTVASGDLTSRIEVTAGGETGQLLRALKEMNESLVGIVDRVNTSASNIAAASHQITAGNSDLASRTEQQASSLQQTAASMEELTSAVSHNADNAQQAGHEAHAAWEVAQKGGEVVSQVVQTMASINESARRIADITGVIDGIAFQTNILALNAAVEAARAGSEGRGFAVVASEVRNLAQRSAAAAKEIKELINESVDKVDGGAKLVVLAGETMDEIVTSVRRVTDIMSEIGAASEEQRAGIAQINQAVSHMDQVTQSNAALVEESYAAAQSLEEQAQALTVATKVFRIEKATPADRQTRESVREPVREPASSNEHKVLALARKRRAPEPAAAPIPAAGYKRIGNGSPVITESWEQF